MIPLHKLQKIAQDAYPGKTTTASHLLFVWADGEPDELSRLLSKSGLSVEQLKQALEPLIAEPAEEDRRIVTECIHSVSEGSVTGWHLLNTLCGQPGHRITKALVEAGIDLKGLRKGLDENAPQDRLVLMCMQAAKVGPLLKYGRDLTEEAATGAFDDLCDRPQQMKSLLRILLRKQKANPVLTGHAGVGKTALVELLARDLVHKNVPERLIGTRLFEIGMGKLVAGTKYRGEFEERFDTVMEALKQAEPAILFIDEFHLVWGAGRAEGAPMDAANMLKPLLNRGKLRIIGATTSEEYHRYIMRDSALARRFEELRLEEPDRELLLKMVKKQSEELERHHKIEIPDAIVSHAIELANLHLPNLHQPDKTIGLLDSSASNAAARKMPTLTEDDLLETLEGQTGRKLRLDDVGRASLLELGPKLRQRIIGQDEAIEKVISTLIYRCQHLGEAERNLGSFLFIGSTGVGKTELARSLAIALFGNEDHLLRLDMAEYGGYDATQKLIGSSGFLAGSDEGVLANWLYARGSGVILIDEIEKASEAVRNLLLGMLDRGRIRNARGEELDTRQCVVVLTSNALKPGALKRQPSGFSRDDKGRRDIVELLSDRFPHEFLGRLDEIVLFNDLGDGELKEILKMHLKEELSQFGRDGVSVKYDEEQLLEHLFRGLKEAKTSGARGVKRLLQRMLMQPLAVALAGYGGKRPATVILNDEFYRAGKVEIIPRVGESATQVRSGGDARDR